jgi:hypothetical protein
LLSEALKIIQTHCKKNYESKCMIKIYIFACFEETDLHILVKNNKQQYEAAKRSLNPHIQQILSARRLIRRAAGSTRS